MVPMVANHKVLSSRIVAFQINELQTLKIISVALLGNRPAIFVFFNTSIQDPLSPALMHNGCRSRRKTQVKLSRWTLDDSNLWLDFPESAKAGISISRVIFMKLTLTIFFDSSECEHHKLMGVKHKVQQSTHPAKALCHQLFSTKDGGLFQENSVFTSFFPDLESPWLFCVLQHIQPEPFIHQPFDTKDGCLFQDNMMVISQPYP